MKSELLAATVITGASSGIGRELARAAATRGRALLLIGRNGEALNQIAYELSSVGVRAIPFPLDVRRPDSASAIDRCLAEHQLFCDELVNSAGFGIFGAAAEVEEELQAELIDVNVRATVQLTRHFLPAMISRRSGGVLNVGSITGYAPGPYMASYCASKAFVRSYSAAIAAEVAGTGVRVTCLAPGVVRTAFFNRKPMASAHNKMMKLLPRGDAAVTAKVAWKAFDAGKSVTIPRAVDRFIISICWIVPDRLLARFVSLLNRSGPVIRG